MQIAGWWRTAIIYFVSSMGGNMMSALLVPYHAYTGAAIPVYGLFGSIVCMAGASRLGCSSPQVVELAFSWRVR